MAARLTKAEAKKLGIVVEQQARKRTTRKTAKAAYHTQCVTCGERFDSEAAEERHLVEHHHARYELVLGEVPHAG